MQGVIPDDYLSQLQGPGINSGSGSSTFTLRIFKNDFVPHRGMVNSDFVEADFSGYGAASGLTFSGPIVSGGVSAYSITPTTFTVASGGVGNDVFGWYLQDSGGRLVAAGRDDATPVLMNVEGASYEVSIVYKFVSKFPLPTP